MNLAYFSGQLILHLPKKQLIAACKGHNEEELNKGKRFKGNSVYPDHHSIRKDYA